MAIASVKDVFIASFIDEAMFVVYPFDQSGFVFCFRGTCKMVDFLSMCSIFVISSSSASACFASSSKVRERASV